MTMSEPTFSSAMETSALTSSSSGKGSLSPSVPIQFRWPNWVSSRLSSGWKRMIIAMTTDEANFVMNQSRVSSRRNLARIATTMITSTPFRSWMARVFARNR